MPNRSAAAEAASLESPAVPLTVEGYSVLHQMVRVKRPEWRKLRPNTKTEIVHEAVGTLSRMEQQQDGPSAIFSMLGHKADLMLVHFRRDFTELNRAQLEIGRLKLGEYLEHTTSYVSMIELGLYESSTKVYEDLMSKGLKPHTEPWKQEISATLDRQRDAMKSRLFPAIPDSRYACFYPMNRLRGESKNWYSLPIDERARQMHEHGMVGRRYAGEVRQIISGSIGFDDWEWGVDLFADDPLSFKKLIYEMRFDPVSAVYALFGAFYVGLRLRPADLGKWLDGDLPVSPTAPQP